MREHRGPTWLDPDLYAELDPSEED